MIRESSKDARRPKVNKGPQHYIDLMFYAVDVIGLESVVKDCWYKNNLSNYYILSCLPGTCTDNWVAKLTS